MKNGDKVYNVDQIYIYNPELLAGEDFNYELMYLTEEKNGLRKFENIFDGKRENATKLNCFLYDNLGDFNTHYNFLDFVSYNELNILNDKISHDELKKCWEGINKGLLLGKFSFPKQKIKKLSI